MTSTREMRAKEITSLAIKAINEKKYGFCALNFANEDMVGHTGKLEPTVKTFETVDTCMGKIISE